MIDFIFNIKSVKHNSLIISGKATTNHLDRHGESITISPNAFYQAKKAFLDKGGKMLAEHGMDRKYGSRTVGRVINMEYSPKEYSIDSPKPLDMSIDVVAELTDPNIIEDVLSNKKGAFSLAWKTKNWLVNQKTKQRIDTEVEFNELTVTSDPANRKATFHVVTDEALAKQYKLGKTVKVYDTLANVKCVFTDELGHYFVDVEFVDEIVNVKTASKIPFEAVEDEITVNVKPLYKVNVKALDRFTNYPQAASNNAKKAIEWKKKYGKEVKGGTQVGWTRAGQLARREALSLSTVKRIKSFFARHDGNQSVSSENKQTPYKDAGYVAWLLWGGSSMKSWVDSLSLD